MFKWIPQRTAMLGIAIGLTALCDQPAHAMEQPDRWQTLIDLQQPKIGRCSLGIQVSHHHLSFNGLGNLVLSVHEGEDITYELHVDQQLFVGDLRLPARAFKRVLVFNAVTSQSLIDAASSANNLTLVEAYSTDNKELRHDFPLGGFKPAYKEFEQCLAQS